MAVISQTPLRLSLCSSDYPEHYLQFGGACVGFAVNKRIYLNVRRTPPNAHHHTRVVYSEIETVNNNDEIQHKAINQTLRYLGIVYGVEVIHWSDMMAKTGMGSSASFIVGLLKALSYIENRELKDKELALAAFHIEKNMMGVTTGLQDFLHSSYGGISKFTFHKDGSIIRSPLILKYDAEAHFRSHLLLFDSGIYRSASQVADTFVGKKENTELNQNLTNLSILCFDALKELDMDRLGKLVEEGWQLKRRLSSSISNEVLDDIHDTAISNGAMACRVSGAGSGGVVLVIAPPSRHGCIRDALSGLKEVDFNITHSGSRIAFQVED